MNKRASSILDNFEDVILACLFVVMCLFVFVQVVSRYAFRAPLVYTEEAARYLYVWITYFGLSVATKHENHIRIELLTTLTRGKVSKIIELVINIGSLLLYGVLVIVGAEYTLNNTIQKSPAMEIPKAFVYISLPLGALLSIVRLLAIIRRDVRSLHTTTTGSE